MLYDDILLSLLFLHPYFPSFPISFSSLKGKSLAFVLGSQMTDAKLLPSIAPCWWWGGRGAPLTEEAVCKSLAKTRMSCGGGSDRRAINSLELFLPVHLFLYPFFKACKIKKVWICLFFYYYSTPVLLASYCLCSPLLASPWSLRISSMGESCVLWCADVPKIPSWKHPEVQAVGVAHFWVSQGKWLPSSAFRENHNVCSLPFPHRCTLCAIPSELISFLCISVWLQSS